MNNIERFTTLKLEFSRVAWYLGNILSALLGREIHCTAKAEDDSYWSIAAIDDRFTNSEIVSLIQYVGGDATMIRRCIPPDSNSSRSLGMDLCEALLKHVLKMDWKQEFVTEDALWILGNWPEPVQLPEADENLIFIDSRVIDCSKLMTMDEFVEKDHLRRIAQQIGIQRIIHHIVCHPLTKIGKNTFIQLPIGISEGFQLQISIHRICYTDLINQLVNI